MLPEGDDRPPKKPGRSGRSDQPEYTVYGRGGGSRKPKSPARKEKREPAGGDPGETAERGEPAGGDPGETAARGKPASEKSKPPGEKPDYNVYRSRPGIRDRLRKPDLAGLRRGGGGGGWRDRIRGVGGGGRRRWLRWVLIAVAGWLLISFVAFALSSQIQKGKLPDSAKDELSPAPPLLGSNVLILGGDRRGPSQKRATGVEAQGPPRADSIMVVHTALGSFRKLSIPRDAYASIPDCGTQKINASLSCNAEDDEGNPASTIRTVEEFLGIDINHIVIVDFEGFADLIDAVGGVTVDVPANNKVGDVCKLKNRTLVVRGHIDGGKEAGGVSIGLTAGKHTLEGEKALAFARLRKNICDPSEDDIDRAARQQLVLNGIKSRLTSPLRAPINFVKGPIIGWTAPKAFVSDMGGIALPQLALTSIFSGGDTNVLEPVADGPGGSLLISPSECREEVERLLGGDGPRDPACSPGI